ncbi:MAG: nucleoside hydrolase [Chloroflexi bacterium]|nr:nucleoside hydrolase [Chloroflexota bacterium]
MNGLPTVLDVDTGIDDALALLLALRSPELEIVGASCVAGNVMLDQVVRNTLGVLAVAGAHRVPVAAGARRPLLRRLTTATFFHGEDGIGGVALPAASREPLAEPAPAFLCRLAREFGGRLNVVAVGPLTNVALACVLDSSFAARLERLVVMGGAATVPGNVTPVAEANFYNDPEAARIVFESGARLTMVGLDVTMRALFEAQRYHLLRDVIAAGQDPVARFAWAVLDRYLKADLAAGLTGSPLHDPLAVAALVRPELLTCRALHVEIETGGRLSAGQSVANVNGLVERLESRGDHDDVVGLDRPPPNCDVALVVDSTAFIDLFCERLGLSVSPRQHTQ